MSTPAGNSEDHQPDPSLYPELIAAGSLANALAHEAGNTGVDVAFHGGAGRSRLTSASVRAPDGHIDVTIGAIERWFVVSIWSRGVALAAGKTAALDAVVVAAGAWTSGASLTSLHARCPFLEITDLALAHEQGPAVAVAEQWHQLRTGWASDERLRRTAEVIESAHAEPALRQLFPYTSHAALCFSTCTGYPYSNDIPRIEPHEHGYVISAHGAVLGEASTPEGAIAIVLAHLPPNLGPAVEGTAGS